MNKHIEELSKPVAWFTDDYQTDKSATTYSIEVAQRWAEKPWSVGRLYSQEYVDALLAKLEAERQRTAEITEQYVDRATALTFATLRAEAAEARLLVPDEWNELGPTYPDHYKPVLVAMNGIVQHITYQIEEGEMGDYWQPVDNEDADGAPMTQFQHWKSLPSGPVNPVEGGEPVAIAPAPAGVIMRPAFEKTLERCAAARDGECFHKDCPQLRDNEPRATGRHCPIDNWDD